MKMRDVLGSMLCACVIHLSIVWSIGAAENAGARGAVSPFIAADVEQIEGAFAPGADCEKLICKAIDDAKSRVWVQMYNFTSEAIAKSMIAAKKRGLDVKFIGDRSVKTEKDSKLPDLAGAGIECYLDAKHPIAHNKILIVDDNKLGTGSFNYSEHAKKNAENYLIISSKTLVTEYAANFEEHREHSEAYAAAEILPEEK